jgi:hypothetical protein
MVKNYCKTCAIKRGWKLKEGSQSLCNLISQCDICGLTYELFEDKCWDKKVLLNEQGNKRQG